MQVRDLVAAAADHLDGLVDARALRHGHVFDLHDPARGVFGIPQELGHLGRHVARHLVEHRASPTGRQRGEQVGGVVRVERLDETTELVVRQACDQLVLGVGRDQAQDFGCPVYSQKAEHLVLELGFFEDVQQFGRVGRVQPGNARAHDGVVAELGLNDQMLQRGRLDRGRRRGGDVGSLRFHASAAAGGNERGVPR